MTVKHLVIAKALENHPEAKQAWEGLIYARQQARSSGGPRGLGQDEQVAKAEAAFSAQVDAVLASLGYTAN